MEAPPSRIVTVPELAAAPRLLKRAPSTFHAATPHRPRPRRSLCAASFRSSLLPGDDVIGEEVLRAFLEERQLNGDAISKASDMVWRWGALNSVGTEDCAMPATAHHLEELDEESSGGYLKLAKTKEWILGDNSAPLNKKLAAREWEDNSEKRKKINLMRYEALKRELMLLTAGIGAACTGYCLISFSLQVAISYTFGVLLSCVYLQLLYRHVDSLSKETVPPVFVQRRSRKIGIRSEDLKNSLERILNGSGIALSSPRLVIPAAIYGLSALSNHLSSDYFHFQLVPAMLGLFAYKAAALVQVYRDNEDLKLVFPENDGDPNDG